MFGNCYITHVLLNTTYSRQINPLNVALKIELFIVASKSSRFKSLRNIVAPPLFPLPPLRLACFMRRSLCLYTLTLSLRPSVCVLCAETSQVFRSVAHHFTSFILHGLTFPENTVCRSNDSVYLLQPRCASKDIPNNFATAGSHLKVFGSKSMTQGIVSRMIK